MTSILTGDIVNSRAAGSLQVWLEPLKELLSGFGEAPKVWEIYRGDSFQLEVQKPQEAFRTALRIKACIKSAGNLDVRMAIGIGAKSFEAPRITESNGEAFIRSGETFESLKKLRKNLAIRSPWPDTDKTLNLMIDLAAMAMDRWSPSSARLIVLLLSHPELTQQELGDRLGKNQSSVSESQKRAHYQQMAALESYFRETIAAHLQFP